jgi:hypothetical protein
MTDKISMMAKPASYEAALTIINDDYIQGIIGYLNTKERPTTNENYIKCYG